MSGANEVENVYSAIEESARLVGVPCSRDNIWPIVDAYKDGLPEAVISISVATDKAHAGELDYTITVPPGNGDPHAVALSNGFVTETDHPVGSLLSDIVDRFPVRGYAVDCGVIGGFKKIYSYFLLDDMPSASKLADIPSMPRAVAKNGDLFAGHGLEANNVTMTTIDYQSKTVNLYFGKLSAECLEPKNLQSLLREIGLPEVGEQTMEIIRKSFSIYVTVNWDSPDISRICFATPPSPELITLPAELEPGVEQFVNNAAYDYPGKRVLIYGIACSPGGEYYKVGSYYRLAPQTRKQLAAFNTGENKA
ncbi:aromatic prenyltransferase [Streptomyces litchfieldiae]|uniref:Aromatic prenyltransferase n=1 Tax=Streptomyces litchfieldiae TaxID=3075543 RepID=A0ABU2MQI2_9ACTN|nr:aromatic prenyltransferase [Streptomyces sp. DSM 44938]MDT0342864.1 aromatic prenyltransferase [Streptomyces sp. DSM 44938]